MSHSISIWTDITAWSKSGKSPPNCNGVCIYGRCDRTEIIQEKATTTSPRVAGKRQNVITLPVFSYFKNDYTKTPIIYDPTVEKS